MRAAAATADAADKTALYQRGEPPGANFAPSAKRLREKGLPHHYVLGERCAVFLMHFVCTQGAAQPERERDRALVPRLAGDFSITIYLFSSKS
jgi:hypothetical protein